MVAAVLKMKCFQVFMMSRSSSGPGLFLQFFFYCTFEQNIWHMLKNSPKSACPPVPGENESFTCREWPLGDDDITAEKTARKMNGVTILIELAFFFVFNQVMKRKHVLGNISNGLKLLWDSSYSSAAILWLSMRFSQFCTRWWKTFVWAVFKRSAHTNHVKSTTTTEVLLTFDFGKRPPSRNPPVPENVPLEQTPLRDSIYRLHTHRASLESHSEKNMLVFTVIFKKLNTWLVGLSWMQWYDIKWEHIRNVGMVHKNLRCHENWKKYFCWFF